MGWKVYFWVVIIIMLFGLLIGGINSISFGSPLEVITTVAGFLSLFGLYSFAFSKKLFSQRIWKIIFWFTVIPLLLSIINSFIPLYSIIPLDYFNKYKIDLTNIFHLLTVVFFLPSIYAVYRLAYGQEVVEKEASKEGKNKLGYKALVIELIQNSIWGLILGVVLAILQSDPTAQTNTFLGAVLLSLVWGWLQYENFFYKVDDEGIVIEQGVLNRKRVSIPYKNIQNVDTSRSIFERMFGLSEVKIQTAGSTSGYEGVIPNIEQSAAEHIHQKIFSKTK